MGEEGGRGGDKQNKIGNEICASGNFLDLNRRFVAPTHSSRTVKCVERKYTHSHLYMR